MYVGSSDTFLCVSFEYLRPQKNIWLYSRYQKANGNRKTMALKSNESPKWINYLLNQW
jgi:hypothetical protein